MRQRRLIPLLFFSLFCLSVTNTMAGTSFDIGTVNGTPPIGEVNWLAWLDKNIQAGGYPDEIITEDNTNSASGVNQGYQDFGAIPNPKWIIQVENFSDETNGDSVNVLLGGLGASSGSIWEHSFNWTTSESTTDHGEVPLSTNTGACPIIDSSSSSASGNTINWTATAAGDFHIYRSPNGSGAGNNASNGRYQHVGTVDTAGASGSYTDTSAGEGTNNWYIVVPADTDGTINGCHSNEEGPLAPPLSIQLASFLAAPTPNNILITWQTVSELDNLGFNLHRSLSNSGGEEMIQLNSSLIPAQAPGSGQGSAYEFTDQDIEMGQTYYYWLEDMDINGQATLHGPVSATASEPLAITINGLTTKQGPSGELAWALLALVILGGVLTIRRHRN